MSVFEVETHAGTPIRAGKTRLIPFAQTIQLRIPGVPTGIRWSRPTAILAQTPDGQEMVLPIRDVTREAQLTLFGLGLLVAMIIWLMNRNPETVQV